MNIREIIEIRDKLKKDLDIVEKFLEIAKRQGLANGESIEKKLSVSNADQPLLQSVVEQTGGYGSVGKAVWEAIKLSPLEFTITDVSQSIKEVDSSITKQQIANTLARLTRQKKIQAIEKKQGRKPAIYKRL
ncbi:MAG TPA: hypothetical protein VHG89_05970 [Verrucomicrobiae bacterium]|nr:hypothetical protein [Verrucomicrobiae bacterium]